MRLLTTRLHGALDMIVGVLLIASPWLFHFTHSDLATWLPLVAGVLVLTMSLFTDYEWGVIPRLPAPVHLGLDVGIGVLLIVAPWAVGFYHHVWAPHVLFGLFVLGTALGTNPVPSRSRLPAESEAYARR